MVPELETGARVVFAEMRSKSLSADGPKWEKYSSVASKNEERSKVRYGHLEVLFCFGRRGFVCASKGMFSPLAPATF